MHILMVGMFTEVALLVKSSAACGLVKEVQSWPDSVTEYLVHEQTSPICPVELGNVWDRWPAEGLKP